MAIVSSKEVASCHREMLGSVLSVWTHDLTGLKWPIQYGRISLPNESGQDFQGIPPEAGEWMRPRSGPLYDSVRCSTQKARLCLECSGPRRPLMANTMLTCFSAEGEQSRPRGGAMRRSALS